LQLKLAISAKEENKVYIFDAKSGNNQPMHVIEVTNNNKHAYAGQPNSFTHPRAVLVLHDRGIFWPRQLASLGKRYFFCKYFMHDSYLSSPGLTDVHTQILIRHSPRIAT
jgi:hypothetical protein